MESKWLLFITELDFVEAKNGASRDIALALGVPPMLLGIPGDNTYANYQEANRSFWRQSVLPLVERIAAELDVVISVDTSTPALMTEAARLGAGLLNDVRALRHRLGELAARLPGDSGRRGRG